MSHTPKTVGIDIGKNSFHVVGHDERGAIVLRRKWSRGQLEARFANMSPCLVGTEACVGAHHFSRKLKALGHDARLMPAKYVRPYSKGQKNDFRDAEAIAEAVQRPTMKFVATKTADQLDLQALHRVRERLVSQRTGIINQIRAFLLERGIAVRQGQRFLRAELPRILATPPEVLSPRMVRMIEGLTGDWRRLDERIDSLSGEIEAIARQDAGCERLMSVPGIGPIISSAMVAAIGTGDAFSKGRDFAAWLGLVPKQMSTGDRTILGKGVTGYRRPTPPRAGMMASKLFVYEVERDGYRCPQGQLLAYVTTDRTGYRHYKSDPAICRSCPLLASCTSNRNATRLIIRHVWADARERADAHRLTPWGKRIYKRRKETVERSFADAKQLHGHRYARFRGLLAVTCQCLLAAAAQNIKKIALALALRPALA